MNLTDEELIELGRRIERHALGVEFWEWRYARGFEPTPAQTALLLHCEKLVVEACPALFFSEWDAEHDAAPG